MSEKYTQGLLKAFNLYAQPEIRDEAENFIANLNDDGPRAVADARRLVACWNACEGMEDPEAEVAALRKDSEYLLASEKLRAKVSVQRDQLLAALESAQGQINHLIGYGGGTGGFDEFKPLIDKVKGGAA